MALPAPWQCLVFNGPISMSVPASQHASEGAADSVGKPMPTSCNRCLVYGTTGSILSRTYQDIYHHTTWSISMPNTVANEYVYDGLEGKESRSKL